MSNVSMYVDCLERVPRSAVPYPANRPGAGKLEKVRFALRGSRRLWVARSGDGRERQSCQRR